MAHCVVVTRGVRGSVGWEPSGWRTDQHGALARVQPPSHSEEATLLDDDIGNLLLQPPNKPLLILLRAILSEVGLSRYTTPYTRTTALVASDSSTSNPTIIHNHASTRAHGTPSQTPWPSLRRRGTRTQT